MTHLEKLIKAAVERTTVTTISAETEHAAEEMAREILKDPSFRNEMRQLIRRHFTRTMVALGRNGRSRARSGRSRVTDRP